MIAYPILQEFEYHKYIDAVIKAYSKKIFGDKQPAYTLSVRTYIKRGTIDKVESAISLRISRDKYHICTISEDIKYLKSNDISERDKELESVLKSLHLTHLKNINNKHYESLIRKCLSKYSRKYII